MHGSCRYCACLDGRERGPFFTIGRSAARYHGQCRDVPAVLTRECYTGRQGGGVHSISGSGDTLKETGRTSDLPPSTRYLCTSCHVTTDPPATQRPKTQPQRRKEETSKRALLATFSSEHLDPSGRYAEVCNGLVHCSVSVVVEFLLVHKG